MVPPSEVILTDTLASIESGSTSGSEKRRSSRVPAAIPITVSGVDALGEAFRELTTTLSISCNGCKYKSKNYVQRDSLVTLEITHPNPRFSPRVIRGRARWVQRPRNLREQYEIGLEFVVSGNVWGLQSPPPDWFPHPDDEALQQEESAGAPQGSGAPIAATSAAEDLETLEDATAVMRSKSAVEIEEIDISGAIGFSPEESEPAPADLNARLQQTIAASLKTMVEGMAEEAAQDIEARIAVMIDEVRAACGIVTEEIEAKVRAALGEALNPEQLEALAEPVEKPGKKRARKSSRKKSRQAGDADADGR
jgi:hypothetical protein